MYYTRRTIFVLSLLLSVACLGWAGWHAQAARTTAVASTRALSYSASSTLATTITVNSTADTVANDGVCTLREAITAANTNTASGVTPGECAAGMAGADTITFSVTGTIGLTAGELTLAEAVTITGPGADVLSVSGNNASRVFAINSGVTAAISGLTITGGNGVGASSSGNGGGIFNQGNLTLIASHVTGNTAVGAGGIRSSGPLTVERSAITNNTATGSPGAGGGVAGGTLIVSNSTVSGNRATGPGGSNAGSIESGGTVTITASTITDNEAAGPNSASGVRAGAGTVVTLRNTIIAANRNNTNRPDVLVSSSSGTFVSQGYNLIGNPGTVTTFTSTSDQVGTIAAPLNPLLGPLINNGGPTPTHRPLAGSPALDRGNSFGLTVDQRGSPRPVDRPAIANATGGDGADSGAYELLDPVVPSTPLVIIVDLIACTGPGNVLTVTVAIINPAVVAQPVTLTSTLPAELVGLPGTSTSTTGAPPIVTASGAAFGPTTVAAGQTLTLTYQVQVGDVVGGAQLCINTTSTSSDAASLSVQTCTMVDCPPVGPGLPFPSTSEASDQKAGSVLVYNLYSSSAAAPNIQNTRLSITNTNPALDIAVHLFFVDGTTCAVADAVICLTQNQTATALASDLDPGTTGYLVAVAVDATTGCPVNFNFLIGDAYIKLTSGHQANLGAEAFAALAGGPVACDANSLTAQLNFDGVSYNRVPRTVAASSIPARTDGNDTLLIVNRFGGNLAVGAGTLLDFFGIFYDDAENGLSFSLSPGLCQFRSSLSNNFPRTTPRLETFIPAGRSGWLRLHSASDIGLLGAVLNFNPTAGTAAGAFNQGRNLHKLTLTGTQTLVIPIFPPNCLN